MSRTLYVNLGRSIFTYKSNTYNKSTHPLTLLEINTIVLNSPVHFTAFMGVAALLFRREELRGGRLSAESSSAAPTRKQQRFKKSPIHFHRFTCIVHIKH